MLKMPVDVRRFVMRGVIALSLGTLPSAATSQTVVSLTFDDGNADQFQVRNVLAAHGMHATFYVMSGSLGQTGYLTQGELLLLASDGNEVGGHTVSHADLPAVDDDEKRRQVCTDRVALLDLGLAVTNFAYPYADSDAASEQVVAACGYNSARSVGGVNAADGCFGCPFAETIPPYDAFHILAADSNKSWTTLQEMKDYVLQAERNGGGWVVIVHHRVCDACDPYSVSLANFTAFLDWLQPRASQGTVVKTVREVIGGPVKPPVSPPPPPVHPPGANLLLNPSLELNSGGDAAAPDCWLRGGFGTNTSTWGLTSDAEDGSWAQRVAISSYTDGARRLVSRQDLGACAPAAWPGHSYTLSGWYKSTLQPRFLAYYRTKAGGWVWWAQSDLLPASAAWVKRTWTIPALPAAATALSVGLSIYGVGTLTVDNFSLTDADTTPPTVALLAPLDASTVSGIVSLSASASDAGGINHLEFLVNGSAVGVVSAPPYLVPWDSTTVQTPKVAIAARAVDLSGNSSTTPSIEVAISNLPPIDTTPPTTGLRSPSDGAALKGLVNLLADATDNVGVQHVEFLLNGKLFGSSFAPPYSVAWNTDLEPEGPMTIVARSFDTSGNTSLSPGVTVWVDRSPPTVAISAPVDGATVSGTTSLAVIATDNYAVARVDFTVNGTLVATTDGAPWTADWDTTASPDFSAIVVATAYDMAGNASTSTPVIVTVSTSGPDVFPPTTAISCNGGACASGWAGTPVQVVLSAVDTGGAGVLMTRYTTDGTTPTLNNGQTYTGPFTLTGFTTVQYRSWDTVLNQEPTNTQTVQVDVFPPATTVWCNGTPCRGWYAGPISVVLAGGDAGGSGVAQTIYTTDGSQPTAGNGTAYAGPFMVTGSATLTFRSWDVAGNAEPPRTEALRIDMISPASTLTCNSVACSGWYNKPVAVAITATDTTSGVASIRYTTDGTPPGSSSILYGVPFAVSTPVTIRWASWDLAGNAEAPKSVAVQVDLTPPTNVMVASPPNGATVTGTVVFLGSALDNIGVYRMRFFLDGKQLGTRTKLPLQWMWDTSTVTKGSHRLHVVADDLAGNQAASPAITVTVQ